MVLDLGTLQVKAGYAGEDTPKYVFPSVRLLLCRPASVVDSQVPTACYWPFSTTHTDLLIAFCCTMPAQASCQGVHNLAARPDVAFASSCAVGGCAGGRRP